MGSVWRICMWILGLKGLTVLTVITIFALWPWDLNSIFLGRRVHKKNQFEKECLLNPHWGNRTTKQNTGLFRFHHHCNPTVTNLCSSNFFSLSTCVTPTLKCTENSSTVQVLSQHAILAFWYFKKLNSEKKKKLNFGSKTFVWKLWWNPTSFPGLSPTYRSVGKGRRVPWEWGCQGTDKIWSYNEVLFPYISLLLWKRKSFLILRTW